MRTNYQIRMNGEDITGRFRERLIRLQVALRTGERADAMELVVDDRDDAIQLPRRGAVLEVALGYEETQLFGLGAFGVDRIALERPPATLTIAGQAAEMGGGIKLPKDRSWEGVTLGAMVRKIAADHHLAPRVAPAFDAIPIGFLSQTAESDLHLLTRLGRQYGAVIKPMGGKLFALVRGGGKGVSGDGPCAEIRRDMVTGYRFFLADRPGVDGVVTFWQDLANAGMEECLAGTDGHVLRMRHPYPDAASAKAAARARRAQLHEETATGTLFLAGRPDLTAGMRLTLSGFREGGEGVWIAEEVIHELSDGFRTTVVVKRPVSAA